MLQFIRCSDVYAVRRLCVPTTLHPIHLTLTLPPTLTYGGRLRVPPTRPIGVDPEHM